MDTPRANARDRLRRAGPRDRGAAQRANGWPHSTSPACRLSCTTGPSASPARCAKRSARIASATPTIFVAYGDCGTGGELDAVLAEEGVERIAGAHCYEFFAGRDDVRRARRRGARHVLPDRFPVAAFRHAGDPRPGHRPPSGAAAAYFGNYRAPRLSRRRRRTPSARSQAQAHRRSGSGSRIEYRVTGYRRARRAPGHLREALDGPSHMAKLILISWRDIPAQVIVKRGRETAKGNCRRGSRKRSTARRCAPARAARTPISPSGGAREPRPCGDDIEGGSGRRGEPHRSAIHRRRPRAADPRQGACRAAVRPPTPQPPADTRCTPSGSGRCATRARLETFYHGFEAMLVRARIRCGARSAISALERRWPRSSARSRASCSTARCAASAC